MRSALIDTNLLLLLIVGLYDRDLIENHKRTKEYTKEDFDLLCNCLNGYQTIWITAHCLAEVSNLLKQNSRNSNNQLIKFLIEVTDKFRESHIHKEFLYQKQYFSRLGVADTGITIKAKRVDCVFTVDFDLYNEISKLGHKVINFNNYRLEHMIS